MNDREYYTFSGWFNINALRILIFSYHDADNNHYDTDGSVFMPKFNEDTWTYFVCTFKITKSGNSRFRLEFDNPGNEDKSTNCYIDA